MLTGQGSDPSTAAMDEVESFRRIHVQPYSGNFLRALFEIGENLRTLVIDMLAIDVGESELIDAAPFADRYTDIIRDFEVLRNTNISPSLEIQKRTEHMSKTRQIIMWQWVLRTAQLLFPPRPSFPIQPSVRQAINPIIDWLQEGRSLVHNFSNWSPVPPLFNSNRDRSPEQLRMFHHYHGLINPRPRVRDSSIHAFRKVHDPGLFYSPNDAIDLDSDCFDTPSARASWG